MTATQSFFLTAPLPQPIAPPYALTTPAFRFRALASLAGRAPLGGAREVVLATYLVARLTDDCRASKELPQATRMTRANAARSWLASIVLPGPVRSALTRLVETTEGEIAGVATALSAVIVAAGPYLDDGGRTELERLGRALAI